jgi:enamine deaminase RidA (YjgF/YER057c/UK114 family)
MKYETIKYHNIRIASCQFIVEEGVNEYHVMLHVTQINDRFEHQLNDINEAFSYCISVFGGNTRPVFKRYFLSDAANQASLVQEREEKYPPCAVSIVQQPPMDGSKIALWAYLKSEVEPEVSESFFIEKHNAYRHIWMAGKYLSEDSAFGQTDWLFRQYASALEQEGCRLENDCVRTWLFVQNIDEKYHEVVQARKSLFETHNLTRQTHYITSTGIEGRSAHPETFVILDAYAVQGLQEGQQRYLRALSHFCPTYKYGVTFERGVVVEYGDRSHIFISGTASINNKGDVVHPGDVAGQTIRTMENISALLSEAGAGFEDLACMIVYLRDPADYSTVNGIVEEHFPAIPRTVVWAPVCRTSWLVEVECIAIKKKNNLRYVNF